MALFGLIFFSVGWKTGTNELSSESILDEGKGSE